MRAFRITKEVCYDIGWLDPVYCKHKMGDVIIPSENLYLTGDRKIYTIESRTGKDMMPHANSDLNLRFKDGQEATDHILKMGRQIHGEDSFYTEIEIDDEKIKKLLEKQRVATNAPQELTDFVNGFLVSVQH